MTTSAKCTAKNPSACRYHGGLTYAKKKEEQASQKLNRAYANAVKGNQSPDAIQRLGKARIAFNAAQAYSDSFESEYEVLTHAFSSFPKEVDGVSTHLSSEYRKYEERVARATETRIKKFNDASNPALPVSKEFPESRADAAHVLKRNNCGAYVGINKKETQKDGKDTFQVVGTKGYYEVQSDGFISAVGTLHSLNEEDTPRGLKEAARTTGENDAIGYRTLYSNTEVQGKVNTVKGYEIFTKNNAITTNSNGEVLSNSSLKTV
jgi:hypothetical protein